MCVLDGFDRASNLGIPPTVSFDGAIETDMTVKTAIQESDGVVKDVFDLLGLTGETERRVPAERLREILREVRQIAGNEGMDESRDGITQYIRENEKFPSGRETRERGARTCRDSGQRFLLDRGWVLISGYEYSTS